MESTALVRAGLGRVGHLPSRRDATACPTPRFEELDGVRIHRYAPPRSGDGPRHLRVGVRLLLDRAPPCCRSASTDGTASTSSRRATRPDTYFALARLYKPFGVRFVFDHHDLCPELLASRDLDNPPSAAAHGGRCGCSSGSTYATADHVITTNESYRDTARARTGKPLDDFTIVRSSPDPALDAARGDAVPELRHGRDHLCRLPRASWATRTASTWCCAPRTCIVNQLGRDDVHFALLGFGDTLEDLKALSTELGPRRPRHVHRPRRARRDRAPTCRPRTSGCAPTRRRRSATGRP